MGPAPRSAKVGWYFVAQALATVLWWAWLAVAPEARGWFFVDAGDAALRPFAVSDLAVIVPLSLWAGREVLTGGAQARMASWLVFGSLLYATLAALGANWPIGQRPWADASMVAACLGSLWAARSVEVGA